VDDDRFWAIVDAARTEVDGWSVNLDRDWADALYAELLGRTAEDILAFDRHLAQLRRHARTPQLAVATELVVRRDPDSTLYPGIWIFQEKFRAFVNCLVMLGRDTFERTVTDPDTLADHPLIRAVADGGLPGSALLAVRVDDTAGNAYCASTGYDSDAYLDLVDPSPANDEWDMGTGDDEVEDDETDGGTEAAWLAEHLPRLLALFPLDA
jgi:hypothetical protein